MDAKKLNKWADLLLDTGKRNNLINFSDRKATTAEILLPSADTLFEKIDGATIFEVFDPEIVEDDDELALPLEGEQLQLEAPETSDSKAAYLAQYSSRIKRQNQLLLYNNATKNPLRAVKNISKKAHEFIEETGVNVAYLAFGFIHWKESPASTQIFRAPILLVPIQLEQSSTIEPIRIHSAEDDWIVNPTFSYKMEAEQGVRLPDYEDEGLSAYLEKVKKTVSKLHWDVSAECKIGIFSFLKINMYRDLKDNAATILANPNVRQLLGEPVASTAESDDCDSMQDDNPLITLHNVVDADSSQLEAIEMAKSGKSFVLQGPPGTGKSQTITNIIAECLSDGKKVLFVSEKLAALNVVYEKLKQAGLSEFCLELHSHKANKKEVIAELCRTLHLGGIQVSSKADREIDIKAKAQRQLDEYAIELHRPRAVIEKSLYQLYEAYAALRTVPDVEWIVPQLAAKGETYLTETGALLEQYVDFLPTIGYDYRKNPWYGYIGQDISFQTKGVLHSQLEQAVQCSTELIPLLQEITDQYGTSCIGMDDAHTWCRFFQFATNSEILTPALLHKERVSEAVSVLQKLQSLCGEITSCRTVLESTLDGDFNRIDGAEYHNKLVKLFKGTFSRLLNAEYKQMINTLRLCKKDGKKPSYQEAVTLTERIAYFQEKTAEYEAAEAPVKPLLGTAYHGLDSDWDAIGKQMEELQAILSTGISFGKLLDAPGFSSEHTNFSNYAERLNAVFAAYPEESLRALANCFDGAIFNLFASDCRVVSEKCMDCLRDFDKLENWYHFRNLLSKLEDQEVIPYLETVIHQNLEPKHILPAFQKLFYYQWIDSILSGTPVLANFNRISQDKAVQTFAEKDTEQFEINKVRIRADLSAQRPMLDMVAPGSALSILLWEGDKKRKQKSIRTLLTEAGELIQKIKPCFLMSPLSVSTYLAADAVHFDVVVFDEASQIFPQDAIGAIYRGNQLIVVGDSKQMPPSNFFNTSVEVEDNDEETGDVTDFESILDLCRAASMQQLRLRWHYRSRYEQLITFSNKNFYDGDLVTFPSSKTDTKGVGVDYYHVEGSLFDRKTHTNRKEAEFVVDLIYQNIEEHPERSLGVVAFSLAQQDLIDKLLAKRRQSTPEKEFFFKSNEQEPFFIKNLETVQGDERDTIIFSVAYGKDAQGRLLHQFGPLNRVGGERRLNVAVTRAKYNVQLVSSMHYTDIDLTRTSAEGPKLLREYLDFAENGEIALERAISVSAYEQFDSEFELEVCEFLRSKGFQVDTQVGCSGFRIDLGLKLPDSSDYVLAIECDGATYHASKNARDRDRLRQEILERMGWKFYRIWSTDWFRNPSVEQLRLLEAAAEAVKHPEKAVPKAEEPQVPVVFEEAAPEKHFEFPVYQEADLPKLRRQYWPRDFKGMVKAILTIEAPLSEEFLLKRIVSCFGREKVTNVVYRAYEEQMRGYQKYGIVRRNGFLYLNGSAPVQFRRPGSLTREIKYIAPEELAAGILEILQQNVSADKNGLFRSIAQQCGVNRVGKTINEYLEQALALLKDSVVMDGDQLSLK